MARILFFLDDQDESLHRSTLEDRRRAVARRFGARDFRRGEEQRIRAIVAGELRSYNVEEDASSREGVGDSIGVRWIRTADELHSEMHRLVREAKSFLGCTGSRSHDDDYLGTIQSHLEERPDLTHYRVLIGHPHFRALVDHLRALDQLRGSIRRRRAGGKIHIAVFEDWRREPERFVIVNDHDALVVMPPLSDIGHFDSAVILSDPPTVSALADYVRRLYAAGRSVHTGDIDALRVLRDE